MVKQKIEDSINKSTDYSLDLVEENHYVIRKMLALLMGGIGEFFGTISQSCIEAEHYIDPDEVLEMTEADIGKLPGLNFKGMLLLVMGVTSCCVEIRPVSVA